MIYRCPKDMLTARKTKPNSYHIQTPDKAMVRSYLEADFWQHVHKKDESVSFNVRLCVIMDYLLRTCPDYVRLREAVSRLSYRDIQTVAVDIERRNVRLMVTEGEEAADEAPEGAETEG